MNIQIRQENTADKQEVYQIHTLAFGQEAEAKLVDTLREDLSAFIPELSLVATEDGMLIAHILFTRIRIISEDGHSC